ncbi:hypothetical protein ALQ60_03811 [Pseudomonas syringae pv. papulans]|nr:Uncharacterized protein ALO65_03245 [Pseudomonas syringae pv. papulans]RMN43794.1 hypothetical protein ALQ60_03811 [Pseudomonas syringae pv. papulans]RMN59439.1 hypothetical protein ALQ56_01968 [Pseudomonas syringae pv. papulans]RMV53055.1 hypothetical protein ALP11_03812 [Pseudomonas syringae pv. papulans]
MKAAAAVQTNLSCVSRTTCAAASSDTSMNTVVIRALRLYLHGQERQELLLDALAKAAAHEAAKAEQEQQA